VIITGQSTTFDNSWLLVGPSHWLLQVLHLLGGLVAAVGLAELLVRRGMARLASHRGAQQRVLKESNWSRNQPLDSTTFRPTLSSPLPGVPTHVTATNAVTIRGASTTPIATYLPVASADTSAPAPTSYRALAPRTAATTLRIAWPATAACCPRRSEVKRGSNSGAVLASSRPEIVDVQRVDELFELGEL
jgi:hypothetical protein